MNAVMNGHRVAWLCGSRYGTPGKVHQLQIQNLKERGTTALLKTQYPMNPLPITPSPHHSIIPPFHYSRLEEREWLAWDYLLSSIFRNLS